MNTSGGCFYAVHSFSKNCHANVIKKKPRTVISTRDSRIQNSYNLLIYLVAGGGWLPVANFTLVLQTWLFGLAIAPPLSSAFRNFASPKCVKR